MRRSRGKQDVALERNRRRREQTVASDGCTGAVRRVLTEAHGIPLAVVIDGANRHDMKLVKPTLEALKLHRPVPSLTSSPS